MLITVYNGCQLRLRLIKETMTKREEKAPAGFEVQQEVQETPHKTDRYQSTITVEYILIVKAKWLA